MAPEEAEILFWEGLKFAKRGEISKALNIAKSLEETRYSGHFEIQAVAFHEAGKADDAISILREGLEVSPVWRLGHLLGIYLSDSGRYDEALEMFDRCLSMKYAEPIATAVNRSVVLNRAGKTEEAISSLEDLLSRQALDDEPEAAEFARKYLADLSNSSRTPPPRRRTTKRGIAFRKP